MTTTTLPIPANGQTFSPAEVEELLREARAQADAERAIRNAEAWDARDAQRAPCALKYYTLAFARLPDGRVGLIADHDLPRDRQTLQLEGGPVLRVLEDAVGWDDRVEEDEQAPPLEAFVEALQAALRAGRPS